LAVAVFGDTIAPRINAERAWYQVYLPPSYRLTHRKHNPIVTWLQDLGIFGLRSYEKRVPERVFAQPAAGIARFLRHLWATDGCIHLSHGASHYANVYYASSSGELARNVQSLLLRLGINATLARRPQTGKGRDQYHVIVSGKADIQRFFTYVGGLGQSKLEHQAAITDLLLGRKAKTNRDVIPNDIWKLILAPAAKAAGLTMSQVQIGAGRARSSGCYHHNLSRERAMRLATVVQSKELTMLADSDVYWDPIVSITPDGEEEVYDLTVEGLHNFVASEMVLHNSIEQDSDMVVFIYREEMYDPETEKKGIAELHIAKHRNGPVGVVNLRFFEKTTRFADLELYREPE
jgi:replicative DNA helicase